MTTTAGDGDAPPAEWNQTQRPFRDDIPVGVLLTEAAEAHASQPAVIVGPPGQPRVLWTYAELAAEARRIAALLRQLGLGRGEHVGVVGHHTPGTVAGAHAALRMRSGRSGSPHRVSSGGYGAPSLYRAHISSACRAARCRASPRASR